MHQPLTGSDHESNNHILRALSPTSRDRLWPFLELVTLTRGQVISRAGSPISHCYFIEAGMVSLGKSMLNGQAVEIGAVGREGMAPAAALLDLNRVVFESVVHIPGTAQRIRRTEFSEALEQDRELRELVRRYVAVALGQLAQTAACNILHLVDQRCCRWLLQAHDSAGSDRFNLTHETLGTILGVRRATISGAAERLQRAGVLAYRYGNVEIVNRRALERAACECYGTTQQEFAALFSAVGDRSRPNLTAHK